MNRRRKRPSRKIIILLAAVVIFIGIIIGMAYPTIDQFRSLRITIHNQSDFDLTNVNASLVQGEGPVNSERDGSVYKLKKDIASGKKVKFTPRLSPSGESSVHLQFTDSRGEIHTKVVCGYTEYLSGKTYVNVTNDNITVKEECW
ncbi:hypothetical protein [Paenibacillus xylanilyticus]|uniref:hypothetical protein n=1 Tax=Paenibacillus xylanilyticus TaxID=248903 RepID=UPI00129ED1FF|nr:hypothetical protein [Paenibacillus xylanilyticus]